MPVQPGGAHSSCSPSPSCGSMDPCSPEVVNRGGRQRLKPWLEAQINSGRYPGVEWIDAKNRIFRMKWKHGGRADWSEEDGLIFKAWAVHTGRYREGIDEPDWPAWKTRLRCAINKLKPDIQELKEMSCHEEPNPFRVFQFMNRKETVSRSPLQSDSSESVTEVDGFRFPATQDRPSVIQPNNGNIPTIVTESLDSKPPADRHEELLDAQVSSLGSDLQNVSIQDLVPESNISLTNISVDTNINSYTEAMETDSLKGASGRAVYMPVKLEPTEEMEQSYLQTAIGDHEMLVTLRFRDEIIQQVQIHEPHGCRVFYGDVPYEAVWDPEMFGRKEAVQIFVPYKPGQLRSEKQDQYTKTVLEGLELGFNIFMDKRNIYVERRCKTRIITAPPNQVYKQTRKVARNEKMKVFDFSQDFLPAFMQYQEGEGPRPSPQVIIAIGQDFHATAEPYSHLFLSVTVCHAQASHLLSQHTAKTTAPEMSQSNQFDQQMKLLKEDKVTISLIDTDQRNNPDLNLELAMML